MNVIKKRILEIKDNGEIVIGSDILLYLHPAGRDHERFLTKKDRFDPAISL